MQHLKIKKIAAVLGFIMLGSALLFLMTKVITPTVNVVVLNDTDDTVVVSSCGSDPLTLRPGVSAAFDENRNDTRAACLIYSHRSGKYAGCLSTPTTKSHLRTYRVSALDISIPENKCGD
ncbi:MAG TPA: hypothetical protein VLH38_05655 [Patescibacteria group bacterium]|nr:hypothetical protein [Patescibacteria group bacterium]